MALAHILLRSTPALRRDQSRKCSTAGTAALLAWSSGEPEALELSVSGKDAGGTSTQAATGGLRADLMEPGGHGKQTTNQGTHFTLRRWMELAPGMNIAPSRRRPLHRMQKGF